MIRRLFIGISLSLSVILIICCLISYFVPLKMITGSLAQLPCMEIHINYGSMSIVRLSHTDDLTTSSSSFYRLRILGWHSMSGASAKIRTARRSSNGIILFADGRSAHADYDIVKPPVPVTLKKIRYAEIFLDLWPVIVLLIIYPIIAFVYTPYRVYRRWRKGQLPEVELTPEPFRQKGLPRTRGTSIIHRTTIGLLLSLCVGLTLCCLISHFKTLRVITGSLDELPCTEINIDHGSSLKIGRLSHIPEVSSPGYSTGNLRILRFHNISGPSATVRMSGVKFTNWRGAYANFEAFDPPNPVPVQNARFIAIYVELWPVIILLFIYPVIAFFRGPYRIYRRSRKGLCLKCDYNLTGNVSGVCPECGEKIVLFHSK